MASDSEEEFIGFENEEVRRGKEQQTGQSSDGWDISVDLTDSEESSSSDSEEIVEEVWSTDDSPVQVQAFFNNLVQLHRFPKKEQP